MHKEIWTAAVGELAFTYMLPIAQLLGCHVCTCSEAYSVIMTCCSAVIFVFFPLGLLSLPLVLILFTTVLASLTAAELYLKKTEAQNIHRLEVCTYQDS